MACIKCGSSWITATGKNCASCPHCCKQARCRERKAGRWVDVVAPRACVRCSRDFTPESVQQHHAKVCPACRTEHKKEWRKKYGQKYRKHGPAQKRTQGQARPLCKRCRKCLPDRRSVYCGRACYNADKKDGVIEWDKAGQVLGSIRRQRAQGRKLPSQTMYAAIQSAMQKHMLEIKLLWQKMNAWRPCLHCGGPLKQHATESTMFCSIPCASEHQHEVSCDECGDLFLRNGVQGKATLCTKCKRKKAASAKRSLGKNIAKRAIRFGVERVPYRRNDLLERDCWTCQLCNVRLLRKWTYHKDTLIPHPQNATLDHIVAMANGGADAPWNIQACCLRCNGMKSSRNKGQLRLHI